MNPMQWKREHQIALGLAVGLGCVIGIVIMTFTVRGCLMMYTGSSRLYLFGVSWSAFLKDCWFAIIGWPILGAAIGAAIIYIKLLIAK